MKTKYAIPRRLVSDLMESGMVQDEEAAMEKIASGEALDGLLNKKQTQLSTLQNEFSHFGDQVVGLSDNINSTKDDIEELKQLIELRDAPSEI